MSVMRRWSAECPTCNGRGHMGAGDLEDDYPCRECFGAGDVEVVPFTDHRGAVESLEEFQAALREAGKGTVSAEWAEYAVGTILARLRT